MEETAISFKFYLKRFELICAKPHFEHLLVHLGYLLINVCIVQVSLMIELELELGKRKPTWNIFNYKQVKSWALVLLQNHHKPP